MPDPVTVFDHTTGTVRMTDDLIGDVSYRCGRYRGTAEILIDAIEHYALWQPGRRGHAAAHRELLETMERTRRSLAEMNGGQTP